MLSYLKKSYSKNLAGIVIDETGTAIVRVRYVGKLATELQSCEFAQNSDDHNALKTLFSRDRALQKSRCSTLLKIGEYQLLVVDAPDVPPQELRAAIRWKIKDLIDFPVDEAVLDVFDAPPGGPAGTSKQMYVVVARSETVKNRIDRLEEGGADLAIIDIPELAMRNLVARLPEDEFGLVTLYFSEQQCLIILTHNATLFLTRTVNFRYGDYSKNTGDIAEFSHRLALEIQRSLDYYEQHFQKAAIQTIAILPLPDNLDGLDMALEEALGLATRSIVLSDVVSSNQVLESSHAANCLLALGCALRQEKKTL